MRVAAAATVVALSGCGRPGSSATGAAQPAPDAGMAVPARIASDEGGATTHGAPPATTAAGDNGAERRSDATSTASGAAPPPAATSVTASPSRGTAPAPAAFTRLASVDDPAGDAGVGAPPYADIRSLTIDSSGSVARLTVTFAGPVPPRLPDAEVMGVGVDLFRGGETESQAQVFADGESTGWFAYVQVGNDVGRYSGTLDIAGTALVFTVPWSSIGDLDRGGARAFADWSRDGTVMVATRDMAPTGTPMPFARGGA